VDKPLNESSRVYNTLVLECAEELDPSNQHAAEAVLYRAVTYKHCVVSCVLPEPRWIASDEFPVHPAGAGRIARGVKESNRMMVHCEASAKGRATIEGNLVHRIGVRIELIVKKAADKCRKTRLVDVCPKIFGIAKASNYSMAV
jgi:hypothetical protein